MFSQCKKQKHGPELLQRNPPNTHENLDVDCVMTKKMQELSCEEREQALYELHGVSDVVQETEELVTQKLEELNDELEKILCAPALKLAIQLSFHYVKKMCILFLRAEQFDTKKAAQRMVRFFELKREAFGDEKLVKDIHWSDLSEEDRSYLEQGTRQILPQRDRSGRAIFWSFGKRTYDQPDGTVVRLIYFMIMKLLEDKEVSKQGIVLIVYNISHTRVQGNRPSMTISVYRALPVRLAASHLCYDDPQLKSLVKEIHLAADKYDLCRFRAHFGSHVECQYTLMTFGIPKIIPVTLDGEVTLSSHNEWVKKIRKDSASSWINKDDEEPPSEAVKIHVPGPMDVLLGRGRHGNNSEGNLRYNNLLDKYRDVYEAGSKDERNAINRKIREAMRASNSRFIKFEEKGWVEVPETAVRKKIAHAFRNFRSKPGSCK